MSAAIIFLAALIVDPPATPNAQDTILKVGPGLPYSIIQAAVDDASSGDK
jgi:hypothetical protein